MSFSKERNHRRLGRQVSKESLVSFSAESNHQRGAAADRLAQEFLQESYTELDFDFTCYKEEEEEQFDSSQNSHKVCDVDYDEAVSLSAKAADNPEDPTKAEN